IDERLDKIAAANLEREAAEVAGKVGAEGFPAVLELWDERAIEFTERWYQNFAAWEKAFDDTANMDYNSKNLVMQHTAAEQRKKWHRYYVSERAKYKAMVDGLGLAGEDSRKVLDLVDKSQQNMKEFYDLRNKKNREFFSQKFDSKEARNVAWDTLQTELLEA
ncbi:MAG: hypothetical protein GTO54_12785, partial [Nitrososphaeria archaeon]|nr:hypothetical protein [Nitrososphaeria archaeon]